MRKEDWGLGGKIGVGQPGEDWRELKGIFSAHHHLAPVALAREHYPLFKSLSSGSSRSNTKVMGSNLTEVK